MSEWVWSVWKVPDTDEPFDVGEFHDVGIYPSGELMAVCNSQETADEVVGYLRDNSPSERFGETMEEAPYVFSVAQEEVWTEGDIHE